MRAYGSPQQQQAAGCGWHCGTQPHQHSQLRAAGMKRLAVPAVGSGRRNRHALRTTALFERFTERAVRAVLLSQREARRGGSSEVGWGR